MKHARSRMHVRMSDRRTRDLRDDRLYLKDWISLRERSRNWFGHVRSTRRNVEHAPVARLERLGAHNAPISRAARARALAVCHRSEFAAVAVERDRRTCGRLSCESRDTAEPFHWYENSWRRSSRSFRVAAVGFNAPYGPPLNRIASPGHPGNQFRRWEIAPYRYSYPYTYASCNQTHVTISTPVVVRPIIWLVILIQDIGMEKILLLCDRATHGTYGTLFRYLRVSDYSLFKYHLFNSWII